MPVFPPEILPYSQEPIPGPPGLKVQIVAYIEELFGPDDSADVADDFEPNKSRGFACDVTIFVRVSDGKSVKHCLVDHYGDGVVYPTFEKAQENIQDLSGVTVERIPGIDEIEIPKHGTIFKRVGRTIIEFEPNTTPPEAVQADVPGVTMPNLWAPADGRAVSFNKPKKKTIQ